MKLVETKLYNHLIVISDYLLVGICWVIVCLPIITIIPATAAILFVLKEWDGSSTGRVLALFFQGFTRRLFANIGLNIVAIMTFYIFNLMLLKKQLQLTIIIAVFAIILLMFLLTWCYHCASTAKSSFIQDFESCSVEVILFLGRNVISLVILFLFYLLIVLFPPFIFIFAGAVWKLIYFCQARKRRTIE